jgi:hypothetical protein
MKKYLLPLILLLSFLFAAPAAAAPCNPPLASADVGQPLFQCYEVGIWKNTGITPQKKYQKRLRPIIREQVYRWVGNQPYPGAHPVWSPTPGPIWQPATFVGKIKIPRDCMFMGHAELNCAASYVLRRNNGKCYRWHQTVTVWKFTGPDGRALGYTGGGEPNERPTGKLARAVKCAAATAVAASAAPKRWLRQEAKRWASTFGWTPRSVEVVETVKKPKRGRETYVLVNAKQGQCHGTLVWHKGRFSHPIRWINQGGADGARYCEWGP